MARTESSSNLCPNTAHTHTLSHTHTHTHIHKTNTHAFQRNNRNEWLITPAGIVNDLPRLRRLSAPLLVRYTAQFEKERDTQKEMERETGSWCRRGRAAGRRRRRLVNRRKWLINERVMPTRGGHLLTPSRPSLSLPLSLDLPLSLARFHNQMKFSHTI